MKKHVVTLSVEVDADDMKHAAEVFAEEYLKKHYPSVEVTVAEGTFGEVHFKSAMEIRAIRTPKTKFLWRMSDYDTPSQALNDGAIYPIDTGLSLEDIRVVLAKAQECLGTNTGLTVSEW